MSVEMEKNVNDVVSIKPITKESWLPQGHDGEIRYTNCSEWLMPVRDPISRKFMTGLDDKQEAILEKKLRLEPGTLSPYNENYWTDHRIAAKLTRDGLVLNPEFPEDKIKLSWLMEHPKVAKSEVDKYEDSDYGYVITSIVQEANIKNKKRSLLQVALKKMWTLSLDEKSDVLKIYGKKITKSTSEELIEDYINTFIEESPEEFLTIIEDPDFKTKILIKEAIQCKALILEGSKYKLNGGDIIAHDIDACVEYLNDSQNGTTKKSLIAKVQLNKK